MNGAPDSIAMDMLIEFEKYHAVMDLFCTRRFCTGNVDLMRQAFETIDGMSEEDIDLAINVYNIADSHDVILFEAEKIMNELVELITDETGLSKEIVELAIGYATVDLRGFPLFELIKLAKQQFSNEILAEDSFVKGKNPLDPIIDETRKLMDAIKNPQDLLNGVADRKRGRRDRGPEDFFVSSVLI